jgi:hypothetical protein
VFVAGEGFVRVNNLQGGIDAWAGAVAPETPSYRLQKIRALGSQRLSRTNERCRRNRAATEL